MSDHSARRDHADQALRPGLTEALTRLRSPDRSLLSSTLAGGLAQTGAGFAAVGGPLQRRWKQAMLELDACIRDQRGVPVLHEGGAYDGAWIESTGTISAEVLSRFVPEVATHTFSLWAEHQREDGLISYKVTQDGPAFSQIQIVTPLARSVWTHHRLHGAEAGPGAGADAAWLRRMYAAMSRNDDWLARHRNTRGTGGVEAFCTFDTGHDLSPRFWFAPDRCLDGEASRCDPEAPGVPYVAPDLTANVACQRAYLALIALELGEDPEPWRQAARTSLEALFAQCWNSEDGTFYDLDATGEPVRVLGDVLLRVLACEVGDGDLFAEALRRHLFNTARFLAHYGFTSLAMDDPRFDADHTRNSWGGPVNFLTMIRAPHAFEHHGRPAELAVVTRPVLTALAVAESFPQCLDPWSGEAGYTSGYSPAVLWMLDAVERLCGVLPLPLGGFAVTSLAPTRLDHGAAAQAVACSRRVTGTAWEALSDDVGTVLLREGVEHLSIPRGWRVELDGLGAVTAVVGVAPHPVTGRLDGPGAPGGGTEELTVAPDERIRWEAGVVVDRGGPEFIAPRHGR
ncbi:MGH1-like glycoside hydrolase domain-containing protein [Nesterenkonia sp. HG001]|uniref:MGH1-like glycoside hydrolase domain-containing protein n=1 Tax=Nesterenkonia sp. HG001 TaxID=2983207 RepID=UPI002AC423CA|nr:hypothetical protein [Nesterenkonia sp. HG001]MDZ5077204.1 hypothetical protein [Nesterenkonia sp. HG001]